MPERRVVQAVLLLALREAERANGAKISCVRLAVGELFAVSQAEITGAWEVLAAGTAAAGAPLHLRTIAAEAQCMNCFRPYQPDHGVIRCPFCGSVGAKILAGLDFHLEGIDLG